MNVAIVTGICVPNDAISNCVVEQATTLARDLGSDHVTVFTQGLGRALPVTAHVVHDPWALLTHESIRRADLVIAHWGIAYDLFDAVSVLASPSRRVAVHFHNTTPGALLSGADRDKAERSIRQAQLMASFDLEVWTYSEFNRRTLASWEVPPDRIFEVPFTIAPPRPLQDHRRTDGVDLVSVGRMVPAKGAAVLVDAVARLDEDLRARTTLHLVTNRALSDPAHVALVESRIDRLGVRSMVRIHDDVSDAQLWDLYERAHVVVSPSFHEGLCVPVIEGYLAGCRAIGTDAGNLPFVVLAPDPVVPVGDPEALAAAITDVVADLGRSGPTPEERRRLTDRYAASSTTRALLGRVHATVS